MTGQCLQQCHQCHHSAYSSAIKNWVFLLVSGMQCHQCHQFPTTHLHMRTHAHVSAVLSREVMALMALVASDLRKHRFAVALSAGTALALVMALPLTNPTNHGSSS